MTKDRPGGINGVMQSIDGLSGKAILEFFPRSVTAVTTELQSGLFSILHAQELVHGSPLPLGKLTDEEAVKIFRLYTALANQEAAMRERRGPRVKVTELGNRGFVAVVATHEFLRHCDQREPLPVMGKFPQLERDCQHSRILATAVERLIQHESMVSLTAK